MHLNIKIKCRYLRVAERKASRECIDRCGIDRRTTRQRKWEKKKGVRTNLIKSSIVIGYEKIAGTTTAGISRGLGNYFVSFFFLFQTGPAQSNHFTKWEETGSESSEVTGRNCVKQGNKFFCFCKKKRNERRRDKTIGR